MVMVAMAAMVTAATVAAPRVAVANGPVTNEPVANEPVAPEADEAALDLQPDLPRHRVGPAVVDLGDGVEIDLPAGVVLFEQAEARTITEAGGDNADGVLALAFRPEGTWSISITLADVGYVSDADANQLDADALFAEIAKGTMRQNATRRAKHTAELFLDSWSSPPSYLSERHTLGWGLALHTADGPVLNELTNVLGRRGYVGLNLIASPDDIVAARLDAASTLDGVRFQSGHRYQDFDARTDRHSGMSLRNLVVGGGVVAVASKVGLLAKIALIAKKALLAIGAVFAGLWKWITGRRKQDAAPGDDGSQA